MLRPCETNTGARATLDAHILVKCQFGLRLLRLGTVAPDTPEGTTLEEDHAPDAGAVVDGEPLDIEDEAWGIHLILHSVW
jgi:hypothetical protein